MHRHSHRSAPSASWLSSLRCITHRGFVPPPRSFKVEIKHQSTEAAPSWGITDHLLTRAPSYPLQNWARFYSQRRFSSSAMTPPFGYLFRERRPTGRVPLTPWLPFRVRQYFRDLKKRAPLRKPLLQLRSTNNYVCAGWYHCRSCGSIKAPFNKPSILSHKDMLICCTGGRTSVRRSDVASATESYPTLV